MDNSFLDDVTINNKPVRELLPDNPFIDADSAYRLIGLFTHLYGFPLPWVEPTIYQQLEAGIKAEYWAYVTGIAPEHQIREDTNHISLLESLMFLRSINKEAESITRTVNRVWERQRARRKLSDEQIETMITLGERVKEGDEFSRRLTKIFRDLRDGR